MAQLYYNNYESGTAGSIPTGFETNGASFTPVISTSNVYEGSKCVQLKKTLGAATGSHWFALDTVTIPSSGDYEVTGSFWFDDSAAIRAGLAFRGKDAATNECYAMILRGGNSLRLSYINGINETVITTATISSYAVDTHYFIRAYCNGSTIKGRWWPASSSEPATWDIDTTSTTLNNTNRCVGFYYFNGVDNADDVFHDVLEVNDFSAGATRKVFIIN